MASSLAKKWVLITGASSGFGAAAATAFAREGSHLILGARRLDRLQQIARDATLAGASSANFYQLDVAAPESVQQFARWLKTFTSRVDVLINNAGGAHGIDTVLEAKEEDWKTMMDTNVLGVLRVTQAILPMMLPFPGGSILNIGSIAGHTAYEGGAAYCAAKAGERKITQALRLELSGSGLRVGSIDPGLAETEFSVVRFKGDSARAKKVYEGVNALTAGDIAETLVWVASRPPHVCIDELVIKPTDQAAIHKIHRRTKT